MNNVKENGNCNTDNQCMYYIILIPNADQQIKKHTNKEFQNKNKNL